MAAAVQHIRTVLHNGIVSGTESENNYNRMPDEEKIKHQNGGMVHYMECVRYDEVCLRRLARIEDLAIDENWSLDVIRSYISMRIGEKGCGWTRPNRAK